MLLVVPAEHGKVQDQTGETFEVPPDFSAERYMANCFGLIHDELARVKVRFTGDAARWVADRKWHPSQKIEKHTRDSITARYRVGGTSEIKRWILGFGPMAEVLEPESLREEINADALELAALYGKKAKHAARSRGR